MSQTLKEGWIDVWMMLYIIAGIYWKLFLFTKGSDNIYYVKTVKMANKDHKLNPFLWKGQHWLLYKDYIITNISHV